MLREFKLEILYERQALTMTDRELLELIAAQVGGLTNKVDGLTSTVDGLTGRLDGLTTTVDGLTGRFDGLTDRFDGLTSTVDGLQQDMKSVKNTMILFENKMESNHKALFDGYKLTYEKLSALEKTVDTAIEEIQNQDTKMKVILVSC